MRDFKIYLSAPADLASRAAVLGPVSLMAYGVGRGLRLMRERSIPDLRCERLMEISFRRLSGFGPQEALADSILRQCLMYGFSGAVLELPRPTPPLIAFAGTLSARFHLRGLDLYLPEGYARVEGRPRVLVPAQNLSGDYRGRLEHLSMTFGADRLALRLDPRPADFALPARRSLPQRVRAPVPGGAASRTFYSDSHEANYMTYMESGRAHLVMWDDPGSVARKLSLARDLGVTTAFLDYSQAGILGPLP